MWTYVVFTLILIAYGVGIDMLAPRLSSRARIQLGLLSPLAASLFWGLRNPSIGLDSLTYVKIFESFSNYALELEPVFRGYVVVLRFLLGTDPTLFLTATSLFLNILFYSGYALLTPAPTFTFAIFFCTFMNYQVHLNIMRQGIAIGFLLMSLGFKVKGRGWMSYVSLLVGAGFHTSILFFAPVLLMKRQRPKMVSLLASITACVLLVWFFNFGELLNNMRSDNWMVVKFVNYFTTSKMPAAGLKTQYLLSFAYAVALACLLPKKSSAKIGYTLKIMAFTFIIIGLFNSNLAVADRTAYYMYCLLPATVWIVYASVKQKAIVVGLISLFLFAWCLKSVFITGEGWFVTPYRTFIDF